MKKSDLKIVPLQNFIKENKDIIDVYFVNDGSLDGTSELILKELVDQKTTFLVNIPANMGKGNALRKGMLEI